MRLGNKYAKTTYTMIDQERKEILEIAETNCERDLGIKITPDLKWKTQVNYAAAKANRVLGMLSRTFIYFNEKMVKTLYTTFVRPHLEFGIPEVHFLGTKKSRRKYKKEQRN